MFTLTWITAEKELERVLKTKETNFVGRKTWKFKAASGEQGENERQ